ncbi:MAG: limonene-1,2-epoxide hydrolase family protein [Mycobacteriales bacterium]|nr:limonene-1,2-epoxide hydrolase family protein [Mycobacteriales bacterium]
MTSPGEVVAAFLTVAAKGEWDAALPMLADDVVYQNMMLPAVTGPAAVRETADQLLSLCGGSEWVTHRQVESGDLVMNERTDRFLIGGEWLDLPVAGVFEVRDGLIAAWRDYFDLQTVMTRAFPDA